MVHNTWALLASVWSHQRSLQWNLIWMELQLCVFLILAIRSCRIAILNLILRLALHRGRLLVLGMNLFGM